MLPADAALPGQCVAGRRWRCLIGVVEIRTFQVQNHLRDTKITQDKTGSLPDVVLFCPTEDASLKKRFVTVVELNVLHVA